MYVHIIIVCAFTILQWHTLVATVYYLVDFHLEVESSLLMVVYKLRLRLEVWRKEVAKYTLLITHE